MLMNLLHANRESPNAEYTIGFLQEGPMVEAVKDLGYNAAVFDSGRLRQLHKYVQTIRDIRSWLEQEGAETVLSWAAKGHLYAGPAALSLGIPAAWYVHSLPDGHWMERAVTLMPAQKVFCCGRTAEKAQQQLWPERSTSVVYIAVDLDLFDPEKYPSPSEAREQLNLPTDVPLVGMVARLQRWKGVHVFIEAAEQVVAEHPNTHFVVVGGSHWSEPNYPDELMQQAQQAGIADQVIFAGHQSNVPLWMQATDCLVHASFDEPTGTVIIEGMAMAKPVVAARTGGPMEFIEEGENGLLADPGDSEELAAAISELVSDKRKRAKLGAAARESASYFNVNRLANDVARNLRAMVA